MFSPDLRCRPSINVHISIHIWHWLTVASDSITQNLFRRRNSSRFKVREHVLNDPSLALALISLSLQPETSELPPLHFFCTLCRLRLLLFSGTLMWSYTGRSAAPCPAVSAAVSCGVWAEAGVPGVQEAPAPRCSPASSPALRATSRRRTRGQHMVTGDGFLLPDRKSILFSCTRQLRWIRPTLVWCGPRLYRY